MFRSSAILAFVTLTGCAGKTAPAPVDSAPSPDLCAGTWLAHSEELPGGTCGAIADELQSDQLVPTVTQCDPMRGSSGMPFHGCQGSGTLVCHLGTTKIDSSAILEARPGGYAADETLTISDEQGNTVCSSEYRVTYQPVGGAR